MVPVKTPLMRQLEQHGVDTSDPQQLLKTTIAALQLQRRQLAMLTYALMPDAAPTAAALHGLGETCSLIDGELGAVTEMLSALQR